MAKVHVKLNDQVYILSGKSAGTTGKVLSVIPATGRVVVEGVNLVTKHQKPRSRTQTGGIIKQEAPISASNVMVVCPHCKRPSKVGYRIAEDGEKSRVCKACGEAISIVRKSK